MGGIGDYGIEDFGDTVRIHGLLMGQQTAARHKVYARSRTGHELAIKRLGYQNYTARMGPGSNPVFVKAEWLVLRKIELANGKWDCRIIMRWPVRGEAEKEEGE